MNPFTLVYDEIFRIAKSNTILQPYVKEGNYILMDGKQHTKSNAAGTADFPELLLTQTSFAGIVASSSQAQVSPIYNWVATLGSWDLQHLGNEILFGLLTASFAWCAELTKLTWNQRSFVKNVVVGTVEITVLDTEQNRGLVGWTFNWPIEVSLFLPLSEIRAYQCQDPISDNMGVSTD